ncbi:MAG: SDR family oxidoreductase [Methylacidiphilales bacterium]|nr:SDR family oxidoreductase [Candidatus Methylacidiphilales bacterium]
MKNQVAILTGAAGGVGIATLEKLLERGARVVAVDVAKQVESLPARYGSNVVAVRDDVTQSAAADRAVRTALDTWSRLDMLLNVSGVTVPKNIVDITEEEWDRVMDGNAKSVFLMCKRAIPEFLRQGSGVIVNTASISSVVGLSGQSAYCASKGAVLQLTRQLAVEYASRNIRVNAVGPGAIDTPFLTRYFDAQPDPEATRKAVAAAHPMGRWAQPEEVASTIVYLASSEASFVTGTILMVDGGYTAA